MDQIEQALSKSKTMIGKLTRWGLVDVSTEIGTEGPQQPGIRITDEGALACLVLRMLELVPKDELGARPHADDRDLQALLTISNSLRDAVQSAAATLGTHAKERNVDIDR